jgi:hypothetical protein
MAGTNDLAKRRRKNSTAPAASTTNAAAIAAHPQPGVPPGWHWPAATAGGADEAGGPAARGVAACRGQTVAVDVEGRTGTGVSGVHSGVAAPTISAIPVPPAGGLSVDQLLLS